MVPSLGPYVLGPRIGEVFLVLFLGFVRVAFGAKRGWVFFEGMSSFFGDELELFVFLGEDFVPVIFEVGVEAVSDFPLLTFKPEVFAGPVGDVTGRDSSSGVGFKNRGRVLFSFVDEFGGVGFHGVKIGGRRCLFGCKGRGLLVR